jgi:hypothetical protein
LSQERQFDGDLKSVMLWLVVGLRQTVKEEKTMSNNYKRPCLALSVTDAVSRSFGKTDPDADLDLPVVAAIADVVVAGVEVYTVVTSKKTEEAAA